jgi:hypothetical protein
MMTPAFGGSVMATCRIVWLSVMVVLGAAISPCPANPGEPLHVGVSETDITPPQGFLIAGYYHERRATGRLDPLKAKAIVFRSGKEQAALVVCDLTGIAVDLSTEIRRRASTKTGIPINHISSRLRIRTLPPTTAATSTSIWAARPGRRINLGTRSS